MAGCDEATVGISRLHHPVLSLGPGRRIGIWFQGCSIRCAGCMSRDTWEPAAADDRVPLSHVTNWVEVVTATAEQAGTPVDGITISGGEPFDQPGALASLTRWLRDRFDPKPVDLLVYTGYRYEVVSRQHSALLTGIDVLVTEPYRQEAAGGRRWRGSANQRMIPLSALGRQRYAEHIDGPADTSVQVDVRPGGMHIIGVPQPGHLDRFEESLAARGVALEECSWTT